MAIWDEWSLTDRGMSILVWSRWKRLTDGLIRVVDDRH